MNPSCAVTKLMDADGWRPSFWYRSLDPVKRRANSATAACSRQKSRTESRYIPFHSDQSTGKFPTWYPPGPTSQGSAMSLTCESTGSWWITSKNAERRSTS